MDIMLMIASSSLKTYILMKLDKNGIAKRIAQEIKEGDYINLGIGIPTLVANFIPGK